MEKRYGVLRFVAALWKILAWLILVLGFLGALATLILGIAGVGGPGLWRSLGMDPLYGRGAIAFGVMGFLIGTVSSVIYFMLFYAVGQLLLLFIDVEENTRLLRIWVENQLPPTE
ncbi:MAG: hypothetical protein ACLFU8_16685 [Anaerolineales bacterium]